MALLRSEDAPPVIELLITGLEAVVSVEGALEESASQLERAMTEAPIPMMIHAEDGEILALNRAWTENSGYSLGDIPTMAVWIEKVAGEDVAEAQAIVAGIHRNTGPTAGGEHVILTADGQERVWDFCDAPLGTHPDGRRLVITTATDMTERKQMEDSLQRNEAKYRSLFNNAEVGMLRTKLDGSAFLDANDKFLEIVGYAREDLSSTPTTTFWADAREREAMARTLEATGRIVDLEFGLLTKQGDVKRCLTSLKLDPDTGTLEGSVIDITDRVNAEKLAARQAERIEQTLNSVVAIASSIVELRDPYTAGHQRRVSELAAKVAEGLGMSGHEIEDIRIAGLLHDMGKAAIPAEILVKPGALSPIEFTLIQGHAEAGYRLALSANMADPISQMIYQHHERCDGSGYPRALVADQLRMGAKVLAVADVVEAMMSHRPYRAALGIEAALAEIERGAGTLYDPWVAEACVRAFNEGGFEFSKQ